VIAKPEDSFTCFRCGESFVKGYDSKRVACFSCRREIMLDLVSQANPKLLDLR